MMTEWTDDNVIWLGDITRDSVRQAYMRRAARRHATVKGKRSAPRVIQITDQGNVDRDYPRKR